MQLTIRPATLADVPHVSNNLLQEGINDMFRSGSNPALAMAEGVILDECYVAITDNGDYMALVGIGEGGNIWLQMTTKVKKHPLAFIRATKKFLNERPEPLLYNEIDIQNTALIKLVKKLGFKVINVVQPWGARNYHVEIVKLWSGERQ
jgi:hypothetical protein